MDRLEIRGGQRLQGEVYVSGAKNATLPILAAALLGDGPVVLEKVPHLNDVTTTVKLLRRLGVEIIFHDGVRLEVAASLPARCDLILMADVLYDRANLALLATAQRHANEVLVADSRIRELPDPAYVHVTNIDAATFPNLGEFDEFGTVRVFHRPAAEV